MNNQYIKKMSHEEVVALALPHLQKAGLLPETLTEARTSMGFRFNRSLS